ncbi:hypothetical protein [Mycobacteroides abscessus]|uniref:hypothetical protein n=1 Tax=Mycobacteroides abscessus TaxID=36809 RepID=UPI001041C4F1|nr:hypothetical protein [Mycobacteroides abscessus]
MTDTQEKLTARDRARRAQAVALEEQRKREAANLKDLEKYFKATDERDKVTAKYEADVRKLTDAYEPKRQRFEGEAAEALAAMKDRGESATSIAALTGLNVTEVTALTKKANDTDSGEGSAEKNNGGDGKPKTSATSPKPSAIANEASEASAQETVDESAATA